MSARAAEVRSIACGALALALVALELLAAPLPLEPVALEPKLQPDVEYGVAVVKSSGDKPAAEEFVAGLIEGEGQEDLRAVGFLPAP